MHRQVGPVHMSQWHNLHFPYTINSVPLSCHSYELLSPMEIMACGIVTCSSGIHQDPETSIMNPTMQVHEHVALQRQWRTVSNSMSTSYCILHNDSECITSDEWTRIALSAAFHHGQIINQPPMIPRSIWSIFRTLSNLSGPIWIETILMKA